LPRDVKHGRGALESRLASRWKPITSGFAARHTSSGRTRDDFTFLLGEMELKRFGSQGQGDWLCSR
jgi:recombinational DNA repair ATPase RecF